MSKPRRNLKLVKEAHAPGTPNGSPGSIDSSAFLQVVFKIFNENTQLRTAYEKLYTQTIQALMRCLEERDAYTYGHCMRVMEYSVLIARGAGLTENEIRRIELSAMFHDLGKIGIPDCVLLKPGRLDPKEQAVIRDHALKGSEILNMIEAFHEIVPGVRHHHERIDGQGYPDHLSGNQIPLTSRVILVADTFDAMTSTRPYRKGLPIETAYEELERFAGAQFDVEYVKIFLKEHRRLLSGIETPNLKIFKKAA